MTRQEELNEAWCKYMNKCSTEIMQALAFALRWCDQHPNWISVEDELPPRKKAFNYLSINVLATDGNEIYKSFYDYSIGGWFDDNLFRLDNITHWMPLPSVEHIAGISNKTACPDCFVSQYPPCGKDIPCCKCHEEDCNSRQPCPKKGGEE